MCQNSSSVLPEPWPSPPSAMEGGGSKSSISAPSEAATFGPLPPLLLLLPPLSPPLPPPYQGLLLLNDWKSKAIFQTVPGRLMNHTALLADILFFLHLDGSPQNEDILFLIFHFS